MSARKREEDIISITHQRDWLLDVIAFIVIAGYFVMCAFIAFEKISNQENQVVNMMFGQLTGGFIMVLSYYFGSTKSQVINKN